MTTAVATPTIEKQQFRNNSPGWLGYVQIDGKGQERGRSVEPGGTIWLSEAEQILTANAPRRPEDNPFIEQELPFGVNEQGEAVVKRVVPLTPISENRFVPAGDRPIPSADMATQPTEAADAPAAAPVAETTEAPAPPVPARARAAVQAASLQGAEVPSSVVETEITKAPAAEETAAVEAPEEHKETGAAVEPSQEAAQGEYAAKEEVGTPEAAAAAPTPYTPPEEG